jgi:hypothetical protein
MEGLINLLNARPKFYNGPPRHMDPSVERVVAMNSSHSLPPERVKVVLEACRSVRYEGGYYWTFVRPLTA